MSRAFILINRERRKGPRRLTTMTDHEGESGPRHIPIQYPESEGPVVKTTMTAISWLIGYSTALVLVTAFVYVLVLKSESKDLRLLLANDYAKKSEIIGAPTYHLEQTAQNEKIQQMRQELDLLRHELDQHDREIATMKEKLNKVR